MTGPADLEPHELEELICLEGRRWLDALPPCLEGSDVLEALRPAIAAWHAHELELEQDPLPGLER